MRQFKKIILSLSIFLFAASAIASDNIEKIVFVRHGEKPNGGLGQLTCQGLNRSLMLPAYFKKNFPAPNFIFAPDPGIKVKESDFDNAKYSYVRPLATIEPTAIALGLPVDTQIGYDQPEKLIQTLLEEKYHHAVIYVAWEHGNIMKIAHDLLNKFNNHAVVPDWKDSDFNTVFVATIDWNAKPVTMKFDVTSENMHDISKICPSA